jgi:hypothetical protein
MEVNNHSNLCYLLAFMEISCRFNTLQYGKFKKHSA